METIALRQQLVVLERTARRARFIDVDRLFRIVCAKLAASWQQVLLNGTYTGVFEDPLSGWALPANNQGVMDLLDSALVYKADGMYAGMETIIPVPEPGVSGWLSSGGLRLGLRRLVTLSVSQNGYLQRTAVLA